MCQLSFQFIRKQKLLGIGKDFHNSYKKTKKTKKQTLKEITLKQNKITNRCYNHINYNQNKKIKNKKQHTQLQTF